MGTSALLLLATAMPYSPAATAAEPEPTEVVVSVERGQASWQEFSKILAHVYTTHPQLLSAREALKLQEERIEQAFAGFMPSINASGDIGRQRRRINSGDWLYGDVEGGTLFAEQPLFNGFGTMSSLRAEKKRLLAEKSRLVAEEQSVLLRTVSAWVNVIERAEILAYSSDNLHRMYQLNEATATRFDAGDATATDLAQTQSRLAAAEAQFADAHADHDVALSEFNSTTGLRMFVPPYVPVPTALPESVAGAKEEARARHPQLKQYLYEEEAAKDDIETAEAELWPSLSLRGSMSTSRSPEIGLNRLRNDRVTLNLQIPLYQGGAEYSRIRSAKAVRNQLRYDSMDTAMIAERRAEQAWHNYKAAWSVTASRHRAAEAAGKAMHGFSREYQEGLRPLPDLLDAQEKFLNFQIKQAQAERGAVLESYRLLAAVGRLNADDLELPVDRQDSDDNSQDVASMWQVF